MKKNNLKNYKKITTIKFVIKSDWAMKKSTWTIFFNRKRKCTIIWNNLKSSCNVLPKQFQPMYLEQVCFASSRAGWSATKIYSKYTFEKECFKKNFIWMNQRSRQYAKTSIEKDFYKIMNNSDMIWLYLIDMITQI